MANSPGANSSGGNFGLTVAGFDDPFATSGIGGKGQKELPVNPDMPTVGALSSPTSARYQPTEQHGHEPMGLPGSQLPGGATIEEGNNAGQPGSAGYVSKGHGSDSSSQPAQAKRKGQV